MKIEPFAPTYPIWKCVIMPNTDSTLDDIRRDDTTVTTALRARPHLDFTISIFSETNMYTFVICYTMDKLEYLCNVTARTNTD